MGQSLMLFLFGLFFDLGGVSHGQASPPWFGESLFPTNSGFQLEFNGTEGFEYTLLSSTWFCGEATECEVTLEIKESAQDKYQSEKK